MNHYLAYGPYDVPQKPPHYMKNSVQLVEQPDGTFRRLVLVELDRIELARRLEENDQRIDANQPWKHP